mmetsp:Transcript_13385/g.20663  ORF Transcript_13385/g.20663 Transcript_13385/m.20663 type:complete len:83 (-) Transcript_13385:57-305(-)
MSRAAKPNYTLSEDVRLTRCVISVSEDPVVGRNQKGGSGNKLDVVIALFWFGFGLAFPHKINRKPKPLSGYPFSKKEQGLGR